MEYDEGVLWAVDYVMDVTETSAGNVETETKVSYRKGGKVVTFGYLDAYCDGHLFDLKTGHVSRDYVPQMAVYAAALCQRDSLDGVTIHVLYSESRTAYSAHISAGDAKSIIDDIVSRAKSSEEEIPCDYCSWCGRKGECVAIRRTVMSVVDFAEQGLPSVDSISSVTNPLTMSKLKDVAGVAKVWVDAVNKHATTFNNMPNYKLVAKKPSVEITNTLKAFASVPREIFLEACSISFSKLASVYAKKLGVTVEESKSELSTLLEDSIKTGQPTKYWRKK